MGRYLRRFLKRRKKMKKENNTFGLGIAIGLLLIGVWSVLHGL
jgi:hypothetical protein